MKDLLYRCSKSDTFLMNCNILKSIHRHGTGQVLSADMLWSYGKERRSCSQAAAGDDTLKTGTLKQVYGKKWYGYR